MRQQGLTLVELIVAIALASMVGVLVTSMFITSNQAYMDQNRILDTQRSGRINLDAIVRSLREAGFDPLGSADAGIREATANKVRFTRDLNINGTIDTGGEEIISYVLAGGELRKIFDEGETSQRQVVIAEGVSQFNLDYVDKDNLMFAAPGTFAGDPNRDDDDKGLVDIRSIVLTIAFQDEKRSGADFQRDYTTSFLCRNLVEND